MKIRDIKDPKVQQMAVVEEIKQRPNRKLDYILDDDLVREAFNWDDSLQGPMFWVSVANDKTPKYTDKGLWYKFIKENEAFTFGNIYECQKDEINSPCAFIDDNGEANGFRFMSKIANETYFTLATPEEVYNHLAQKENNTNLVNSLSDDEKIETTQTSASSINVLAEVNKKRTILGDLQDEIKELEAQNEKLNKLVDEIYTLAENENLTFIESCHLISCKINSYRNPSIVGTRRIVNVDGKDYEALIEREVKNENTK